MTEPLTYGDISPYLNDLFVINHPQFGSQEVKLIKAEDQSSDRLESFSLIFAGAPASLLPQATHAFSHHKLGSHEIFITPVNTSTPETIHYQAVFNRIKN